MVGFDMDYTLALYNQARIEELSMRATLHKLVTAKGYPDEIRGLAYDPMLALRGLVVDRLNGNIFKPDRYGYPGRARHGLSRSSATQIGELYQRERTRLSNRRYAWIDSLFALPEAVLYAVLVDYFDRTTTPSPTTRRCGSTSASASTWRTATGRSRRSCGAQLPSYIERDPGLPETLHKFRSSGKRLFLLTNSAWDYTVAGHELPAATGRRRPRLSAAYPSWRHYFDVIVVSAGKPEFFTESTRSSSSTATASPLAKPAVQPARSSAGASTRAATSATSRSGRRPAAIACCSSATTSTATCCGRESRRTGGRRWSCRSSSTRSRPTIA